MVWCCPSMSTDPGSLKPGPRIRTNTGVGDAVLAKQICIIAQVLGNYFDIPVSEGGSVSSSWKWGPVIKSPAHNSLLLQLPILLHSMTRADIQGTERNIKLNSASFVAVIIFIPHKLHCTLCVQMLDGANWHEAPWKAGLFNFSLWSGHCIHLAFTSNAMIQINIFCQINAI